jgi:uncharacterized coiled-coil DUF342 family protein
MGDSETPKKKFRLRKPDTRDRSEELKIKYYKDPENQKNLRERIDKYKEGIKDLQEKIADLEKYIFDILPEETLR